jgi:hypothetical protein
VPISNQLNNSTSAQLGYQFSANDAVGVSGTYFLANYRDVPVGTQLFDTRSAQVAGFYAHRVTPRNWAGISYRFARLTFTEGSGETLINSILLFDTITLPGKISVSFFAGPESVDVTSPLVGTSVSSPEGKQWSVAATPVSTGLGNGQVSSLTLREGLMTAGACRDPPNRYPSTVGAREIRPFLDSLARATLGKMIL